MDLFEKEKEPDDGFSVDVAKLVVQVKRKYLSHERTMYPFNHILVAARAGSTVITKPREGLHPMKAKRLKELGYDVQLDLKQDKWIISWE